MILSHSLFTVICCDSYLVSAVCHIACYVRSVQHSQLYVPCPDSDYLLSSISSISFPIHSFWSSSSSGVHYYFPSLLIFLIIRWDKSLGGRRIALFHFPAKDESELRLVVGDELQLRLDAGAARLYGE